MAGYIQIHDATTSQPCASLLPAADDVSTYKGAVEMDRDIQDGGKMTMTQVFHLNSIQFTVGMISIVA